MYVKVRQFIPILRLCKQEKKMNMINMQLLLQTKISIVLIFVIINTRLNDILIIYA